MEGYRLLLEDALKLFHVRGVDHLPGISEVSARFKRDLSEVSEASARYTWKDKRGISEVPL